MVECVMFPMVCLFFLLLVNIARGQIDCFSSTLFNRKRSQHWYAVCTQHCMYHLVPDDDFLDTCTGEETRVQVMPSSHGDFMTYPGAQKEQLMTVVHFFEALPLRTALRLVHKYFIVNQHDQTAKVIDTIKLPTCTHYDHNQNVTLRGGIKAGKFTKHGVVKQMKDCIDACCQDRNCSVAFMPGNVCYTVNCYSERLCESIPATPSKSAHGSVQISHIVRGGGNGDEVDEFRKNNGVNRNTVPGGDKCLFSRIMYNTTLAGGTQAGEVIDLGPVIDNRNCALKCCEHANCEVAHIRDGHCFAVDCYTEDLCQSAPITDPSQPPSTLVYVNKRNNVRQKDKDTCVSTCVNGICTKWDTCICDLGYSGPSCNDTEEIGSCDPDCGEHGSCLFNDTCTCDEGWKGYKCHKEIICKDACEHGICLDSKSNQCKCDVGWTGDLCNETNSDKLVMASSGEEVLFTESDIEPEYDIKIHDSPYMGKSESISAVTVAVACGVGAAVLGTAAIIFIVKQVIGRKTISNYELVNKCPSRTTTGKVIP